MYHKRKHTLHRVMLSGKDDFNCKSLERYRKCFLQKPLNVLRQTPRAHHSLKTIGIITEEVRRVDIFSRQKCEIGNIIAAFRIPIQLKNNSIQFNKSYSIYIYIYIYISLNWNNYKSRLIFKICVKPQTAVTLNFNSMAQEAMEC